MVLQGKVAVVAGASPNIGGGIAEELAAAGAAVVAVDVRPENPADCARYINSTGGRALGVTADVTDEAQVEAAVAAAIAAFDNVDILVNGAVIFNRKGVLDMSYAEFDQQTKIILGGAFLFTKHVAKRMIERGGAAPSSTSFRPPAIRANPATSPTRRPNPGCSISRGRQQWSWRATVFASTA